MYALLKLEHLSVRKNPMITTNVSALEAGERFDMGDEDFRMAFAVTHVEGEPKSDPRYIQWVAFVERHDGENY